MTSEQFMGVLFGIVGFGMTYVAIFKPEGLKATRRGARMAEAIGLPATRVISAIMGFLVGMAGFMGLFGYLK